MKSKRFWNILLVATVITCLLAFVAHYKNWTKVKTDSIKILSGFYYQELRYSDMDSVFMVDKIPPMERLNGFSALEKEKGIFREFKDSLVDDAKVYVYVDNLSQQKIKLVHHDSIKVFINFKDSIETQRLFDFFKSKLDTAPD